MKMFATLFLFLAIIPKASQAFDLQILANDKELVSHAFSPHDLALAEMNGRETAESAFRQLALALNTLDAEGEYCEADLILQLRKNLAQNKLDNSLSMIYSWAIVWRNKNWIDDIFFEIIKQTIELHSYIEKFAPASIRSRETRKASILIESEALTINELKTLYSGFQGVTLESMSCLPNSWHRIEKKGVSHSTRILNVLAFQNGLIDETGFRITEALRVHEVHHWNITLQHYLRILTQVKNKLRSQHAEAADSLPNSLSSSYIYRRQTLTFRQSLYYRFDPSQILMITDLLRKTFDRMDATKAELVFTSPDRSESVPISPMGQYYFARKLLERDLRDLNQSSFFQGNPFTYEDMVTAALETGLINSDLLASVLKIDDLWNPEVKQWKIIANYAFQVTGNASVFLPPPYNVISSIALMLIEGVVQRKSKNATQSDAGYDPF